VLFADHSGVLLEADPVLAHEHHVLSPLLLRQMTKGVTAPFADGLLVLEFQK
jgi:hypothetical protein